jgi:amino acid transporter
LPGTKGQTVTSIEATPAPAEDGGGVAAGDPGFREPYPLPVDPVHLPDPGWRYQLKVRLLGPPLHSEQLEHETLGKPTALAVFASDNLSSAAYATEEILAHLVPFVGVAAFALVVPTTVALIVVLGFLILSYRQTIEAYPEAASAYLVTKDNFGLKPALVAAVSLLTDYILTVAVSVAAGTAALVSAFSVLTPYRVPIAVAFIVVIAYGNLRGVRESGKVFAVPTYFFLVNMGLLIASGLVRMAHGGLPHANLDRPGLVEIGHPGSGLLQGAAFFVVLRAFASGGAAVTGVEAISDGVPAFRPTAWRNARTTLTIMGGLLGVMFLGLSTLAAKTHVVPFEHGTPTVISQIGKLVYGGGTLGNILYLMLQAATMLILVLAANTSFADFPRLANFAAIDNFMPRQLMKRGHRLVFSNGVIVLACAAVGLVVATGGVVGRLIPLYAVGVFTSFTLSQSGMARRHWHRRQAGWRKGLLINGTGAVISFVVDVVIAVTKFAAGAWVILLAVPILVVLLMRLNRQYEKEDEALEVDAPRVATAPILRRHVVLVLIDRLDLAAARAIQYARTLMPDELRAVHFITDSKRADELSAQWRRLGLSRVQLDLRECADRVVARAAIEVTAEALDRGDTEVSILLPNRKYRGLWHRILHDQTADQISEEVSRLPHANVTLVPFHLGEPPRSRPAIIPVRRRPAPVHSMPSAALDEGPAPIRSDGTTPIGSVRFRQHATVRGKVRSVRVQPLAGTSTLECVIGDDTGQISVVFLGRRHISGIAVGRTMLAEGILGDHHGRLCFLNPAYELRS